MCLMKNINAYLMFDGGCAQAMQFYQKIFKAELQMSPYSDAPGMPIPPGAENRIMHARLEKGEAVLMASDIMPGMGSGSVYLVAMVFKSVSLAKAKLKSTNLPKHCKRAAKSECRTKKCFGARISVWSPINSASNGCLTLTIRKHDYEIGIS